LISTGGCVGGVGCGNGVLDVGELCDGLFFVGGSNRCVDYSGEFISGFLGCVGCQVSTQNCVGAPVGYDSVFFTGGELSCSSCRISTFGCEGVGGGSCGDGFINIGEHCDGLLFVGGVSLCSDYNSDFTGGVLDVGELCDGLLFVGGVSLCSDYNSDFTGGVLGWL